MTGVAVIQSLGKEFAQLVSQTENQTDAWRAGRIVFQIVGCKLFKIEVIAAIRSGFGLLQRFRRNGEHGESRRQPERLLHPGQADIGAQSLHIDGNRAHRRDGIDDERNLGIFFHHPGDFLQRIQNPGRCFVMNDRHGVVLAGGQRPIDHFRGDRLTPFGAEQVGFEAAASGYVVPLAAEGTVAEVGAAFLHQITHRPFHDAEGAGG